MILAVLVPGILIAVAGASCLFFPARTIGLAAGLLERPAAKWVAGGIRLALGVLVLGGSGVASHPIAVGTAGALLALVGAALLLLPRTRFDALARWSLGLSTGAIRLASLAAAALGVWLCLEAGGGLS